MVSWGPVIREALDWALVNTCPIAASREVIFVFKVHTNEGVLLLLVVACLLGLGVGTLGHSCALSGLRRLARWVLRATADPLPEVRKQRPHSLPAGGL